MPNVAAAARGLAGRSLGPLDIGHHVGRIQRWPVLEPERESVVDDPPGPPHRLGVTAVLGCAQGPPCTPHGSEDSAWMTKPGKGEMG